MSNIWYSIDNPFGSTPAQSIVKITEVEIVKCTTHFITTASGLREAKNGRYRSYFQFKDDAIERVIENLEQRIETSKLNIEHRTNYLHDLIDQLEKFKNETVSQ